MTLTFKSILMLLPFCENGPPSKMSALAPPMADARIQPGKRVFNGYIKDGRKRSRKKSYNAHSVLRWPRTRMSQVS
jgi:hypothetical protein